MTDETFLLIYYGLLVCFLISLIVAILVVLSTMKSRRAARRREQDRAPSSAQPGKTRDDTAAPSGRTDD